MTDLPKFNIGDTIYYAGFDQTIKEIPCPDCGGTKTVIVEYFDGRRVQVECETCRCGYVPPRGTIEVSVFVSSAKKGIISGIRSSFHAKGGWEYEHGWYDPDGDRTFATEEEALAKAESLREDHERNENARLFAKAKDGKTYAWNARYYRDRAKQALKEYENYSQKALNMEAKVKS